MSDAPSKSNADIDKPRRGIGRFLWVNALATSIGTIAIAFTAHTPYLLFPLALGLLVGGAALIFREMFALLGQDSQYQIDEYAQQETPVATTKPERASTAPSVGATPHAA